MTFSVMVALHQTTLCLKCQHLNATSNHIKYMEAPSVKFSYISSQNMYHTFTYSLMRDSTAFLFINFQGPLSNLLDISKLISSRFFLYQGHIKSMHGETKYVEVHFCRNPHTYIHSKRLFTYKYPDDLSLSV